MTPLEPAPYLDALGIYPSLETVAAQGVLVLLALIALWRALTPRALTVPRPAPLPTPLRLATETEQGG